MKIKIIAVPAGEAPEEVRRAWVGLEIPLPAGKRGLIVGQSSGTASGTKSAFRGYSVDTETAVSLLAERAPAAAAWWRQNAARLFQPDRGLGFREEACETIGDGVTDAEHCVLVTFPALRAARGRREGVRDSSAHRRVIARFGPKMHWTALARRR
jgi:hypothetical protein